MADMADTDLVLAALVEDAESAMAADAVMDPVDPAVGLAVDVATVRVVQDVELGAVVDLKDTETTVWLPVHAVPSGLLLLTIPVTLVDPATITAGLLAGTVHTPVDPTSLEPVDPITDPVDPAVGPAVAVVTDPVGLAVDPAVVADSWVTVVMVVTGVAVDPMEEAMADMDTRVVRFLLQFTPTITWALVLVTRRRNVAKSARSRPRLRSLFSGVENQPPSCFHTSMKSGLWLITAMERVRIMFMEREAILFTLNMVTTVLVMANIWEPITRKLMVIMVAMESLMVVMVDMENLMVAMVAMESLMVDMVAMADIER